MSKTKHKRKKAKKPVEVWAVLQDGKPVEAKGLTLLKFFNRKADAQAGCWMGGQEVRRVRIHVI